MPSLKDALIKPENVGDPIPPAPAAPAVPPIVPRETAGLATGSMGPAPSVWTTDYDRVRQWCRPGTSQHRFPPLPTKANPQINASTRTIVTAAINNIPATPAATPVTDGLTHGMTPWEIDPSSQIISEDFFSGPSSTAFGSVYPFSTAASVGGTGTSLWAESGFPNTGQFYLQPPVSTANAGMYAIPLENTYTNVLGTDTRNNLCPYLDYPGWILVWIFKIQRGSGGLNNLTTPFDVTKLSTYIGLGSGAGGTGTAMIEPRPACFIGARYDTDPGTSYNLTAANTVSGYAGSFPAINVLQGCQVTISGFVNPGNNGTFTVTSNSTTALFVNNSSIVNETHAGTATTPALSDSTIKLEATFNPWIQSTSSRNNIQGANGGTFDTGVAVTEGEEYRLIISCPAPNTVSVTLNGVGTTFSLTQTSILSSAGGGTAGAGNGIISCTVAPPGSQYANFAMGSKVTIGNLSGGQAIVNGTRPVQFVTTNAAGLFSFGSGTVGNSGATPSFIYYPGLQPYASCANDSTGSAPAAGSRALFLDYFGFAWNAALRTSGGTADPTLARFF